MLDYIMLDYWQKYPKTYKTPNLGMSGNFWSYPQEKNSLFPFINAYLSAKNQIEPIPFSDINDFRLSA